MKTRLLILIFLVVPLSSCSYFENRYFDTQMNWATECNNSAGDILDALISDMYTYQFEDILDAATTRCVKHGAYFSIFVPSAYVSAQSEVDQAREDFETAFEYMRIDMYSDLAFSYFDAGMTHLSNFLDLSTAVRFQVP